MDSRAEFDSPLFTHFISHYSHPSGPDLLGRTEPFFEWQESRRQAGLWPYSRSLEAAPKPECGVRNETGTVRQGLNFGSQDYLSLSTHPAIMEAAQRAIQDYGLHSAGSAMLGGNTTPSLMLEKALAEHLQMPHVALFSTGWGAGFGVISGLVRPDDHVVLDALSHACLQQGAAAATPNVSRVPHLNNRAMKRKLQEIRARDTRNAVLVVTEGLFSMDSDVPRLEELQSICHEYGAALLVDVAHDLGAMGPQGTGSLGVQGLLGKVDLVMGAFSKTFATNGGFVATRSPAVRQFIRVLGGTHIFSNALLPLQAAVVLESLRIVRSEEGAALRAKARENILALRGAFQARGVKCLGEPSNVVPVQVGDAKVARLSAKKLFERDIFANLVEYPAVRLRESRFRMQVMSAHTLEQVQRAADGVCDAIDEARAELEARPAAARPARRDGLAQAEL
ncbi:aminotransferase class I/II-fold pyridoxal phosphate-dependent enzyme [Comamonas sp. JC664]|uniref:aminotransferase class I/II-fold pyridoxal phosphate-dependent enzyme n=1 Tax=Comamonas sp. JC664 TaxID=2801917 RepID=UPI0017488BF7|nr:aminotransferase class I/II-fold pyridoxal phosphate-dependent enzyme [Comamonas sp. JC664]MBL0693785.1 aminotransferase class I/II-fold pyridoxal phosphate-dependent enzyme [Comamonas sp. JC664]GHG74381.1 8-amino-7-oxononanoate synthase [Comamonas sp. KCTC 72670]